MVVGNDRVIVQLVSERPVVRRSVSHAHTSAFGDDRIDRSIRGKAVTQETNIVGVLGVISFGSSLGRKCTSIGEEPYKSFLGSFPSLE